LNTIPGKGSLTAGIGFNREREGGQRVPVLEIGGRSIEYRVRQGTSRRYTYFRFMPDMRLEVVLPLGVRDPGASLRHRREWILKKYEEMQQSRRILDEARVMFDGRHLDIVYGQVIDREEIVPDLERDTVLIRVSDRSRVTELVRRWFLKETSRYVVGKLSEISVLIPQNYRMADVREMKNWGYCTRTGRLSFSWQLIALPEPLREYIVMHEVTHLRVFDHSRSFKRELAKVCPDYGLREKELDRISPAELSYF
jgi:predicted metal-dependent hydrolase